MTTPREKLAQIMDTCGLNAREISPLLARDETTIRDYLNGEVIPKTAERWISRVQSVQCSATQIVVTFRACGEKPGAAFGRRMLSTRRK